MEWIGADHVARPTTLHTAFAPSPDFLRAGNIRMIFHTRNNVVIAMHVVEAFRMGLCEA